jgi:hypothetical protein
VIRNFKSNTDGRTAYNRRKGHVRVAAKVIYRSSHNGRVQGYFTQAIVLPNRGFRRFQGDFRMSLNDRLSELVRACFTGVWIQSCEHDDGLAEIAEMCRREGWHMATWDIDQGLQLPGQTPGLQADAGGSDPLAAIRAVNALATPESSAILVLVNFHRYLNSPEVIQAVARQILVGKGNRTFLVILSPLVQIPPELEKQILVVEHELPSREQVKSVFASLCTGGTEDEFPEGNEREAILDAAAGLTRYEAEGAGSLSLVRHGRITAEAIWELKSQMLKKSGLLSLHRGKETFAQLGGLDAMKSFCLRAMRFRGGGDPLRHPRGVLLLGVPGSGKSAFAKALGHETGRPTVILDIGSLMGSLVGQTEHNIRQALRLADAMAPCVLFLDEVEKALSGVTNNGDSGVSARLFGTVLTWLNDHDSDVFVVATCNDISRLPPEFARAERFDGVFFLDLPGGEQKRVIWRMYQDLFGIEADQALPDDQDWTGAEIRSCCRLAALLDVPLTAAAQNVVPVAVTAAESITRLRSWASGRCLNAEAPGIYARNPNAVPKQHRHIRRNDPSDN